MIHYILVAIVSLTATAFMLHCLNIWDHEKQEQQRRKRARDGSAPR